MSIFDRQPGDTAPLGNYLGRNVTPAEHRCASLQVRQEILGERVNDLEDAVRHLAVGLTVLIAGMVLAFIFMFVGTSARAHDWYEYSCCSDRDCAPLAEGTVVEGPAGYEIPSTGETIPYFDPRIRKLWSPDGKFHRCHRPDGTTRCLYTPGRGA